MKLNQSFFFACVGVLLTFLGGGCGKQGADKTSYAAIWVSADQANPNRVDFDEANPQNLSSSQGYQKERILVSEDALTPELQSQMVRFGIAVDLNGLARVLTEPLNPPEETPPSEFERAAWLLSVRNIFFGTSADKTVEIHYGPRNLAILALRHGDEKMLTCYEEADGVVVEYLYVPQTDSERPQSSGNEQDLSPKK